jgi:hypothetical protein
VREAWVLHDILRAWGAHPRLRIWRQNTGAAMVKGRLVQFGIPGTPDILGVLAPTGRFLGIECKSATGRQREAQKTFQRVVESMGGVYVLARSVADVDAALAALGITR